MTSGLMAFGKNAASNLVQQLKVKDMDIHRLEADKEHVQHGLEERSEKVRSDEEGFQRALGNEFMDYRWNSLFNYKG